MGLSSHDAVLACVLSAPHLWRAGLTGETLGGPGQVWLRPYSGALHPLVLRQLGRLVKAPEGLWDSLEVCRDWRLLGASFPSYSHLLEGRGLFLTKSQSFNSTHEDPGARC